jgi:hypothetical protein
MANTAYVILNRLPSGLPALSEVQPETLRLKAFLPLASYNSYVRHIYMFRAVTNPKP